MQNIIEINDFLVKSLPKTIPGLVALIADHKDALTTEELSSIDFGSELRLREYSTGRFLAKSLLQRLGSTEMNLPTLSDGQVKWPEGFVGSISHKNKICAVIAAERKSCKSLGLDIEISTKKDTLIIDSILTTNEKNLTSIHSLREDQVINLYLSAKEAFYKYQYPLTGLRFDFLDIEVVFDWDKNRFKVSPICLPRLTAQLVNSGEFTSGFHVFGDLICTHCYS